ncbi:MAG: DUF962 domain-containing protein [Sphingobacteriaceae bacterium]|nr:DUF962 domain-containing protein [Sphingobacteriaceae bacterium]
MRKIDQLLHEYGDSHQDATNKMVHWVCVPLIMFSLIGLLWNIPVTGVKFLLGQAQNPWINWGVLFLLLASLYYVRLSFSLFIGMLLLCWGMAFGNLKLQELGASAHVFISIGIFVVAWIGQFIGHKIEGKKPSFLKDLQFLLVGPAWLMHFIYKKMGIPY